MERATDVAPPAPKPSEKEDKVRSRTERPERAVEVLPPKER